MIGEEVDVGDVVCVGEVVGSRVAEGVGFVVGDTVCVGVGCGGFEE